MSYSANTQTAYWVNGNFLTTLDFPLHLFGCKLLSIYNQPINRCHSKCLMNWRYIARGLWWIYFPRKYWFLKNVATKCEQGNKMWQEIHFLEHHVKLASSKKIQSDPQGFGRGRRNRDSHLGNCQFHFKKSKFQERIEGPDISYSLLRKMNSLE